MFNLLVELLIKPFFSEKLRVIKYYDQKTTALRLMASDRATRQKKGLSLLFELATSYPYRVQEIIDLITKFVRDSFSQQMPIESEERRDLLQLAIRSLTAIPRVDSNRFPHNFDLHQIRVEKIDLTRANFQFFSLWGAQFIEVLMPHSSFEEADLGGTIFHRCSLEYANFKSAKINASFMDRRPTRITLTRLYGSNLHDAQIEACEIHKLPEDVFDEQALQGKRVRML